jgi:hypothetical protein
MSVEEVKKKLNEIVDQAQVRLDLETANNPALRKAIHIVENFLKKTGRVCYGGQAINAQLPQKDQFYNPETSLPDYDFFSPEAADDTESLIAEFKASGYTEISKRIGIHEGTTKIYVNFTAIADITSVIPDFYNNIHKKSTVVHGIRYADPVFLRMMMYLELSRPRGQVDRWKKVYERLILLDQAHPLQGCKYMAHPIVESKAAQVARPDLVRYMIAKKRAFLGADIQILYKPSATRSAPARTRFLLQGSAPVVFLSPDADMDGSILSELTRTKKVPITGYQNILPAMIALYSGEDLVCLIVQEEACHAIISLPLTKQRHLRLASLETVLTFMIGLYYRDEPLLMADSSVQCWLKQYIDLSDRYKIKPTKLIPAFPLECTGYQTSFASLLRAKGARIEAARQQLSRGRMTVQTRGRRFMDRGSRQTRRRFI